jgi:hypothetical protein
VTAPESAARRAAEQDVRDARQMLTAASNDWMFFATSARFDIITKRDDNRRFASVARADLDRTARLLVTALDALEQVDQ